MCFARPAAIYCRICREKQQYSLPASPPNPGLWDYCCSKRIKALAGRENLTGLRGSYRQDLSSRLIPINTFLMSLCCSPLVELTADGRTWLPLPCTERSLDVRCREMEQAWAASREQSEAVRNDSLLQGVRCHCEPDLLNTKHLSEIQRKTSWTSQGGSAFLLREAHVSKQTHLPPGMTQTLHAGISHDTGGPS